MEPGTSYYFGIRSGASRSSLAHLEETHGHLTAEVRHDDADTGNAESGETAHTHARGGEGTTGGGSGGGRGSGSDSQDDSGRGGRRPLSAPHSIQAQAADGEVAFVWRSPLNSPFIHADIVRKEGSFPKTPDDGVTVYEGRDENFTDIGLTNGRKYHYAIFTHDDGVTARGYSKPVLVAMAPRDGVEQINFLEPSVIPAPPVASGELRFGMRNAEVSAFQTLLAKDRSIYPEGIVSGYFGPLTQAAVKRLQAQLGLPQTGIADAQIRSLLSGQTSPAPVDVSSAPSPLQRDLLRGSRGDDVRWLQSFLKAQGLYPTDVTGYFGDYTFAGVESFQQKYGLPVTGAVSTFTRQKILDVSGQ